LSYSSKQYIIEYINSSSIDSYGLQVEGVARQEWKRFGGHVGGVIGMEKLVQIHDTTSVHVATQTHKVSRAITYTLCLLLANS